MYNFKQYILEKFVKHDKYPHHVNPTQSQILQLLKKSKYQELRFIIIDKNMYLWDAYYSTHYIFYFNVIIPEHNEENLRVFSDYTKGYIYVYNGKNIIHIYDERIDKFKQENKKFKLNISSFIDNPKSKVYLNESLEHITEGRFIKDPRQDYWIDPSKQQLLGLLNRSTFKEVKFIIYKDHIYCWDGAYYHHGDFGRELIGDISYGDFDSYGIIRKKEQIVLQIHRINTENLVMNKFSKYGIKIQKYQVGPYADIIKYILEM